MKIYRPSFGETIDGGTIWSAVALAKGRHKDMLRYRRERKWSHEDFVRRERNTILHTVRVIARGLLPRAAKQKEAA